MSETTAILRDAYKLGGALYGHIYNDTKGRFKDGDWVRTSKITEQVSPDIFKTRNSTYRVVSWFDATTQAGEDNG